MFNKYDIDRNACMLDGSFRDKGYDWWWHSFTGVNETTGEEKPFFIEFFIVNPGLSGDEPVFGQLPENKAKGIRPSYLMIKAGCWGKDHAQIHNFYSLKDVKVDFTKTGFFVKTGENFLSEKQIKGHVSVSKEDALAHPEWMSDAGDMSFDLRMDKQVTFNVGYGASSFFRMIKAFEMYWHAQGIKTLFEGEIILNGEKYIVSFDKSYGYADKNWGRGFTSPWVWLSSNCLESKLTGKKLTDSVFDIGGGRPKVYCLALERKLLSAFWYEGKPYEYNFSKFWTGTHTKFSSEETEDKIIWDVWQDNRTSIMETHVECLKEDMLLVNYEAPDGSKRHNRLWNGGNGVGEIKLYKKNGKDLELIDDIIATHIGCEYGEYDS